MDRRGRDQFVIRYGDETEVCWNDHQKQQAEQVHCHPQPLHFCRRADNHRKNRKETIQRYASQLRHLDVEAA